MKIGLVLFLTLIFSLIDLRAGPLEKSNILLILSDDQSYPHLGCYGNNEIMTPNLDKFASQGMRFDRAYCTSPQCVPARASIFSGRSPVAINMTRFYAPLPREIKTFAEHLRSSGWFTGVAGRTYHMDGATSVMPQETQSVFDKYKLVTFPDRLDSVKTSKNEAETIKQMQDFLNQKPAEKPFFLQLCSHDPHRPLTNQGPVRHDPTKLTLPAHYPDTPLIREDFARYYDEIAHLDVFFGEAMSELEKRGLASNTIVVFMADNGCSQFRGKGTLYEYGIHVPLIVRWPGKVKAGSSSLELISGEDLAPTLLEAVGLRIPSEMTGKSFVKLLRGESFSGREFLFSERGAHGTGLPGNSADFDLGRVVVGKKYKLIYNALGELPYWPVDFEKEEFWKELVKSSQSEKIDPKIKKLYFSSTRPMFELFDLERDPSELNNLYGNPQTSEIERELKAAMQEWMILERDFLPLPVTPRDKAGHN